MDPRGWNLNALQQWLSSPVTQEDEFFDLKKELSTDDDGKRRLKKTFCGFANRSGGYIYFGIDKQKNIVGVNEDGEFGTRLAQVLTTHISPATVVWRLYHHISLQTDAKCVYVVKISQSPTKPHVYYNEHDRKEKFCIPYRERGYTGRIIDGAEVRRVFLDVDAFYPEYEFRILNILEQVKAKSVPGFTMTESVLVQGFKTYLLQGASPDSASILCALEAIEKKVAENGKSFSVILADGGVVDQSARTELEVLIDEYIRKYGNRTI